MLNKKIDTKTKQMTELEKQFANMRKITQNQTVTDLQNNDNNDINDNNDKQIKKQFLKGD